MQENAFKWALPLFAATILLFGVWWAWGRVRGRTPPRGAGPGAPGNVE